jgi:hypothetical protein
LDKNTFVSLIHISFIIEKYDNYFTFMYSSIILKISIKNLKVFYSDKILLSKYVIQNLSYKITFLFFIWKILYIIDIHLLFLFMLIFILYIY